jgi:hypothetical protein
LRVGGSKRSEVLLGDPSQAHRRLDRPARIKALQHGADELLNVDNVTQCLPARVEHANVPEP